MEFDFLQRNVYNECVFSLEFLCVDVDRHVVGIFHKNFDLFI